jgi:hypothetical protein
MLLRKQLGDFVRDTQAQSGLKTKRHFQIVVDKRAASRGSFPPQVD